MNLLLIKQLQPFVLATSFLLIYVAEHVFPQRKDLQDKRHDLMNVGIGILNGVLVFVAGYYFQELMTWFNNKQFGLFYLFHVNIIVGVTAQLLLIDLFMYWWHRFNHLIPFLWRFHKLHHTDTKMNSTTALRFHIVELLLSYVARLLVFPLLGISIPVILLYSLVFVPVVILHHSNIRVGNLADRFFRTYIVTPHMHRIHHSDKVDETNSNYSSVFPWWDLVFKTYKRNPGGKIEFGI